MSYLYVGIYWCNHHHLIHLARGVTGAVLVANLHLLFWLSLVPFSTRWMGEEFGVVPVAVYGISLLMPALAYTVLAQILVHLNGRESPLGVAIGRDVKGALSVLLYALGIGLAFAQPWAGFACYLVVALIWLVPDRRLEKAHQQHNPSETQAILHH